MVRGGIDFELRLGQVGDRSTDSPNSLPLTSLRAAVSVPSNFVFLRLLHTWFPLSRSCSDERTPVVAYRSRRKAVTRSSVLDKSSGEALRAAQRDGCEYESRVYAVQALAKLPQHRAVGHLSTRFTIHAVVDMCA